MIRFSASLVVVAVGLLIAGVVTSRLMLVYIAIGVSALALLALAIGAAISRRELFGSKPTQAAAQVGMPESAAAPALQAETAEPELQGVGRPVSAVARSADWPAAPPAAGHLPAEQPRPEQRPQSQPAPAPPSATRPSVVQPAPTQASARVQSPGVAETTIQPVVGGSPAGNSGADKNSDADEFREDTVIVTPPSSQPPSQASPADPAKPDAAKPDAAKPAPAQDQRPAQEQAEPASLDVTVVPGVPRYHRSQCILIRFMGEDDLEKMTVAAARKAGCTPCRACLPDQPDHSPD